MNEILIELVAALIAAACGFVAAIVVGKVRSMRRFGHLNDLVPGDRRVQVVLPSAQVERFLVKQEQTEADFPSNVLIMPMAEGEAIARLMDALHSLPRRVEVSLTTDDAVGRGYGLTISIGGPSVNDFSRTALREHPDFKLVYPEHTAHFGSMSFVPDRGPENDLVEDYGFLFLTRRAGGGTTIVLCGVWGTGTRAAVQGFLELREHRDVRKRLHKDQKLFLAFHTKLSSMGAADVDLIQIRPG